ncbi:ribonuclease H-like domain-containing protein [Tanacetum coccineum]
MTPSSAPSYTILDPTPSPILSTLASTLIPPPKTYETTQPNNTTIPNAEPNIPYGPTPQGPTPTKPSPSPQSTLGSQFDMTDLGALNYFLGISVDRNSTGLFLSQKKYAHQLLERAHMDPTLYRSLAERLQYLTFTRPDLSYAVQQLYASATTSLVGYTDADWAGYPSTRRSTSGYCVFLGDNLLSWSDKLQHTLSRSSAEAEYCGVANVVAETAWLHNLHHELDPPLSTATLVYCDKISAIYMSANPVQHQWTKHIKIDIHFVRDMVTAGEVRILHVPSRYQYADIFIKGLPSALFEEF